MAERADIKQKIIFWNADTPFIQHIKKLKKNAKINRGKKGNQQWTFLSEWSIITDEKLLSKVIWKDVEKVLILAELNWNKEEPLLFFGLELIKSIRFKKSLCIPIALASFLPFETLEKVTENDPVLLEFSGNNYIELGREAWIKKPFDKYFQKQEQTKVLILQHFFERELIAEEEGEHNTLFKLVDDMQICIGSLCNWNYLPKNKMSITLKEHWDAACPELKLLRDCLSNNTKLKKILPESLKEGIQRLDLFSEHTVFSNQVLLELYDQLYFFSENILKINEWQYKIKEIS